MIFKVAKTCSVDKDGASRCLVRSDRGRDTGRETQRIADCGLAAFGSGNGFGTLQSHQNI